MQLTVTYPGRPGAHSAAAAAALFPEADLVPAPSFGAVTDSVTRADAQFGVLPIESSLAGPVAETHDLLFSHRLSIVGEAVLPIRHCLVAPADTTRIRRRASGRGRTATRGKRGIIALDGIVGARVFAP